MLIFCCIFYKHYREQQVCYNTVMKKLKSVSYQPKFCLVGERKKICYETEEEALVGARVAEYEYGIQNLKVYKCEYGEHWHLSSGRG